MGEGFPPIPAKLASKICQGDFIEMGELLSEFWSTPREDDGTLRTEGGRCRSHLVTDIFTRLQCFSMYVNISASHSPAILPKLMPYMSHIIRVHQDWPGSDMIRHFAARQFSQPLRNGQLSILHMFHRVCLGHHQM